MSTFDNSYSRFVAWVKIVLPLAALALLSTMFLLSRTYDPSGALPFADVDVKELAREQRISAPNYSGVTEDGAAIALTAETARPDPEITGLVHATALRARLEAQDGSYLSLTAVSGQIDANQSQAVLDGGVVITTSTGYRIESEAVTTSLTRTEVKTPGQVEANGPPGRLTAGSMVLRETGPGQYLLVFQDGVKLVYTPASQ